MAHSLFLFLISFFFLISYIPFISSLSTIAISETSNLTFICALNQQSYLNCTSFPPGIQIPMISPNTSLSGIVAGNGFQCFLTSPSSSSSSSSTTIMVCWRFSANGTNISNIQHKRIYRSLALNELHAGNSRICGVVNGTNSLECWQWRGYPTNAPNFSSIAVGEDFVCGLSEFGQVTCLGSNTAVVGFENKTENFSVIAAGFNHACAISLNGRLDCWGQMAVEKPQGVFTSVALGENRSCALRYNNETVVCWGENNFSLPESLREIRFTAIEAKRSIFCGVVSSNYSLYCWGNEIIESNFMVFENVMPGPCTSSCRCGPLPDYERFCNGGGYVCRSCVTELSTTEPPSPISPPPVLPPQQNSGSRLNSRLVAFLVVGCVGSASLVIVISFFLFRYCKGRGGCRVHDSGPLDEPTPPRTQSQSEQPQPQPVLEKKLSQLVSMGNGGHLEEFSLQLLLEATENFSEDHKIGTGSFGSVYHGKLDDGREVAIKRAEITSASSYAYGTKRQEDKDNAFLNELEFLSRLNHKNLVRLLGFCEDSNELALVYEYLNNGTLHDHLHKLPSSPLMSWPARLKVALHAARGIEYLHEYAVPQIIHRDIKSSNILLDATWTAKVSDFGLSLMGPDDDESHLSLQVAGTVGYMDPEYYRLQQLSTKSDVYSFGVLLLELLSGYKAIHRNENGVPRNVVDFVVPYIVQDEIHRVLDPKVPPPTPFEIEAVAYVGYLAADCVSLEGRDRPSMTEVVNNLERAVAACLIPPSLSRSTTRSSA